MCFILIPSSNKTVEENWRESRVTLGFQRVSKCRHFREKKCCLRTCSSLFLLGNKIYFDRWKSEVLSFLVRFFVKKKMNRLKFKTWSYYANACIRNSCLFSSQIEDSRLPSCKIKPGRKRRQGITISNYDGNC